MGMRFPRATATEAAKTRLYEVVGQVLDRAQQSGQCPRCLATVPGLTAGRLPRRAGPPTAPSAAVTTPGPPGHGHPRPPLHRRHPLDRGERRAFSSCPCSLRRCQARAAATIYDGYTRRV
jgi:hypothetical protein